MNDTEEEAIAALDEAEKTLEAVDEDGVAARIKKEQEVVDDLTTKLAELYADGLNMNEGHFAQGISECSRMTKTEAKGDITRKIEDINNQGKTSLNAWVANNLNEVRVIRTSDHVSDTRYVWEFDDGTTVETGSNNRTHFMWPEFRNQIFDAAGPYLSTPEDRYTEGKEWAEFMVRLIQERKTEKTSTGPRTRAIEYVKTRIRNAGGYGNVRDAADYRGVYVEVNDDPPDDEDPVDLDVSQQECPLWRVDLLMFPNSWAKDAAEEHDITTRAVQNELDARGMTVEGRQVSETKYVGGQYQTFWKLGGNFASPAAYQPEADDDRDGDDDEDDPQAESDTDAEPSPVDDTDITNVRDIDSSQDIVTTEVTDSTVDTSARNRLKLQGTIQDEDGNIQSISLIDWQKATFNCPRNLNGIPTQIDYIRNAVPIDVDGTLQLEATEDTEIAVRKPGDDSGLPDMKSDNEIPRGITEAWEHSEYDESDIDISNDDSDSDVASDGDDTAEDDSVDESNWGDIGGEE